MIIRCAYDKKPHFPPTDQHPDATRFHVGNWWVDAIGTPTQADIDAIRITVNQNPFPFNEYPPANFSGYSNTNGKILVTSYPEVKTRVVIVGGQSNHCTFCGSQPYVSHNPGAHNLSIYDGNLYIAADPVLGCHSIPEVGPSSIGARLPDAIIDAGDVQRCIVIPIGIGGVQFSTSLPGAPGTLFGRLMAAINWCRFYALEPDHIIWAQGETDGANGTPGATVTAQINAIVDGVRATNCRAPFHLGLFTTVAGQANATIRQALLNAISPIRNIVLGYDADTNLPAATGFRQPDGTHLSESALEKYKAAIAPTL